MLGVQVLVKDVSQKNHSLDYIIYIDRFLIVNKIPIAIIMQYFDKIFTLNSMQEIKIN